jgi:hypothetical protein
MGLTNWRGEKVRKQDVTIAKKYLDENELGALNNLVEQYLIFAEGQAMRRIPMRMNDWIKKLNGFLSLNDRKILEHAGKISHETAKELMARPLRIDYPEEKGRNCNLKLTSPLRQRVSRLKKSDVNKKTAVKI